MKRIDDISNLSVCFCLEVTTTHDLVEQISLITDCRNSLTLWIPCRHRGVFRIRNSTNVADYLRGVSPSLGNVGIASKQIASTWFAAKLQAILISLACCCMADEAEFTYPLSWTNRLCITGSVMHRDVAGFTDVHLLHFFSLTSVKKHWNGSTCNPFETKRLLWLFFTDTLLHQACENLSKLMVER